MSEDNFPSRWPRDARIECANRDAEIERLRKELAGWENMRESYYHLEKLLAEKDNRIEELEEQARLREIDFNNEFGGCEYHDAEIERLRGENEVLKCGLENLSTLFSDEYIITTDKIRAAWELIEWHRMRGAVISARDMERALAELGIVRCEKEGCDNGKDMAEDRWGECSGEPCSDCNGEGFKIGCSDE